MNVEARSSKFATPQAYDLRDESEVARLVREVRGYLKTCIKEHHGTDALGRQYAVNALDEILRGNARLKIET